MVDRIIIIVLDSVGIGELPDAYKFGDEGSNTLNTLVLARSTILWVSLRTLMRRLFMAR
jgi:phosphopentomutase